MEILQFLLAVEGGGIGEVQRGAAFAVAEASVRTGCEEGVDGLGAALGGPVVQGGMAIKIAGVRMEAIVDELGDDGRFHAVVEGAVAIGIVGLRVGAVVDEEIYDVGVHAAVKEGLAVRVSGIELQLATGD